MADPQLVVRNASGQIVLDSRDAVAGCCVEILIVTAGTSVTRTYPEFVGRTAMVLASLMQSMPTVDTALGYPRVTFTAYGPRDRTFAVFML